MFPNESVEDEASTSATPLPLSAAVSVGFAEAVDVTLSVPTREPRTVGVKVTPMAHDAPAATFLLQLLLATVKSPVAFTLFNASVVVEVLVQVKVCEADVIPTTTFP